MNLANHRWLQDCLIRILKFLLGTLISNLELNGSAYSFDFSAVVIGTITVGLDEGTLVHEELEVTCRSSKFCQVGKDYRTRQFGPASVLRELNNSMTVHGLTFRKRVHGQ